jgi:hypothetical protein
MRCLHVRQLPDPQAAEYRRGLSRASTCVSLFIEYWVKDGVDSPAEVYDCLNHLCIACIESNYSRLISSSNARSAVRVFTGEAG